MKPSAALLNFASQALSNLLQSAVTATENLCAGMARSAQLHPEVTEIKLSQYASVKTQDEPDWAHLVTAPECTKEVSRPAEPQRSPPPLLNSSRHKTQALPYRRHLKISQDVEAYSQAYQLVQKMSEQKKTMNQRRQRDEKIMIEKKDRLKKEMEQLFKTRELQERSARRQVIANRIQQEHKRHSEFKLIDQMGNTLVRQIKDRKDTLQTEDKFILAEVQYKTEGKSDSKTPKIDRVKKYRKGKFACLIEELDKQRQEQSKRREQQKYSQLELRKKYGQMPSSMIRKTIEHPKKNSSVQIFEPRKKPSHSVNSKHPTNSSYYKTEPTAQDILQNPTKIELDRLERERELRIRTNRRLKQLQEMDESLKKYEVPKSKYTNYIKHQPRTKHFEQQQTKKIVVNQQLTKQQKYTELIGKAKRFELKAKLKQQTNGDYEQMVGCMVTSIQAKLQLLKLL